MTKVKYYASTIILLLASPLYAQKNRTDQLRLEELMLTLFKTNISEIAESLTKAIGDKEIQQEVAKQEQTRSQRPSPRGAPQRRPSFGRPSYGQRPSYGGRPSFGRPSFGGAGRPSFGRRSSRRPTSPQRRPTSRSRR